MLFSITKGTVSREGQVVLKEFDFFIKGTEKIAIVGRNGTGKTTLLELLEGSLDLDLDEKHPEAGMKRSRAFTTGMLRQHAVEDPEITVEDYVLAACGAIGGQNTGGNDLYSRERFEFEQRFDRMFTELGLNKEDKGKKLGAFSGGEQTKIMLIGLLLAQPDVLILDEPTNHLDTETCQWLEANLKSYPKAVVMVSHDRYFIDQTAEVVWEVAGGKLTQYIGNYSAYRKEKSDRAARQLKAYRAQQEEVERLEDLIKKFKNKPKKAAFARSRKKILDRMETIEKPDPDDAVIHTGDIVPEHMGSKNVLSMEHLKVGYTETLKEISFRMRRGQKIGVFGPNGTGKSTFLKTAAGLLAPLKGRLQIGEGIDLAYFDQMTGAIESEQRVFDYFHDQYPALTGQEVRAHLAGYLFKSEDMGKKVSDLSGGEKARLALAVILEAKPNFLVLDEPTNNMDIPAKETLESIFRDYKGTILFVSHDRYFLSHLADALLFFQPDKETVLYYPFGYDHYMQRKQKLTEDQDPAALREAENQKLIDDLKAVPKGERFRLKELSTEEAYLDWQFAQNRVPRKAAEETFRQECLTEEAYWDGSKMEAAREVWTETLLDWYDIYLSAHEDKNNSEI